MAANNMIGRHPRDRIGYLKCFTNWVKQLLLNKCVNEYLQPAERGNARGVFDAPLGLRAINLGCENKRAVDTWRHFNPKKIYFIDYYNTYVQNCHDRYDEISENNWDNIYDHPEFMNIHYHNFNINGQVDLISSHLRFSTVFASDVFMNNVADRLSQTVRPSGVLHLSVLDGNVLRRLLNGRIGPHVVISDILNIGINTDLENAPAYGVEFRSFLCGRMFEEYFVNIQTLINVLTNRGFRLTYRNTFENIFEKAEFHEINWLFYDADLIVPKDIDTNRNILTCMTMEEREVASLYYALIFIKDN